VAKKTTMRSQSATRSVWAAEAASRALETRPASTTSASSPLNPRRDVARGLLQLGQEVRELLPVGAQACGDQTDPGAPAHLRLKQLAGPAAVGVRHGDLHPRTVVCGSARQDVTRQGSGGVGAMAPTPAPGDQASWWS
jgi:hypothetical protein